ncbi:MAG TPA: DSD1 family PLP-dependent enzyme [Spirochaetia bacterium]|nr:DSD1 family PLP-dependent enzyme [Spirochaetia bacterium]
MQPMTVDTIETPALLIDLEAMEANLRLMSDYMRGRRVRLRPHFKTHKSPAISHLQIAAGAKGVCCAKVSEAEVLLTSGIRDVLIANQVVDPAKTARLAGLARLGAKVTVCVDHPSNVETLSQAAVRAGATLNVLVEVDVGMNRCGVKTAEEALALARKIAASGGLHFEGIQAYEGHLAGEPDIEKRRQGVQEMVRKIGRVKEVIESAGLAVPEISGGGTATYNITGDDTLWTEIQAGSYVFMDSSYGDFGLPFRRSLSILTTVIHTHPGRAVTDAGMKVCSTDHGQPVVKGHPGLEVRTNEEHGIVLDEAGELAYGSRVEFIPSHCCTTVNLHDRYYGVRGGNLEVVWPIPGRGKSQ